MNPFIRVLDLYPPLSLPPGIGARWPPGGARQIVGSQSFYTRTVSTSDPDFELRVAVISVGTTVADTHLVDVVGGGSPVSANITGLTGRCGARSSR